MTISTTTSRQSYNGNGVTTIFSVPFRFFQNADLVVQLVTNSTGASTTLVLGTHYTVSGADAEAGGSVTMVTPPAVGQTLVVRRVIAATQEVDYVAGDPFPAETHERALDRLTMLSQQGEEVNSRSLTLPAGDTTSGEIPQLFIRANKLLAFDSVGRPTVVNPSTDSATDVRMDLASTASGNGAAMVGFAYGSPYLAATVGYELKANEVYVGTNSAADSAGLAAAFARNVGGSVAVVGTVLLTSDVSPGNNTVVDLRKAQIIDKNAVNGYTIRAVGKNGITIIGGRFSPDPSIVTAPHDTGTYGSGSAVQFDDCTDCHLVRANISGFYGAVNFYNCSWCTASSNFLTDNAGGIQLLAASDLPGNPQCVGVSFHDNIVLHSGDDAFSFLIGAGAGVTGSVRMSSIVNNYVSKDANPSGKNTVGLSRGVALIGGQTTTANTIRDCVVAHNRGYMMGTEFLRATGVVRSMIHGNKCVGFAAAPSVTTSPAFTFGSRSTGQYGVIDSVISANSATAADELTVTFQFDGAEGCQIVDNYADSPVPGQGAIRFDNSSKNEIRGNRAKNSSGFGLDLQSTSSDNSVFGGSVEGSTVAMRNDGARNFVENVVGLRKRTAGTAAIGSAATSTTVNHQIELLASTSRLKVLVTANSSLYGASEFWVDTKTTDYFDIKLDAVPGGSNVVYFEWEAWETR